MADPRQYAIQLETLGQPAWVCELESLKILDVNQPAIRYYGHAREAFLSMTFPDVQVAASDVTSLPLTWEGHAAVLFLARVGAPSPDAFDRTIVEHANEGFFVLDMHGVLAFASRRMADLLGYHPAEMVGRPGVDFVLREDRSTLLANFEQRKAGRRSMYDVRLTHKNGSLLWMLLSVSPVFREGSFAGAVGTILDITERKAAELLLRQSEALFSSAHDAAGIGSFEIDLKDGKVYLSEQMRRLFRLPDDAQFSAEFLQSLIHPEDVSGYCERTARAIESASSFQYEFRVHPDYSGGKTRWMASGAKVIRAQDGSQLTLVGINYEITDRKLYEQQVIEANDRMRALRKAFSEITWTAGPDGLATSVEVDGRRPMNLSERPAADWMDLIPVEDRSAFVDAWRTAVRERQPYQLEHRLVSPDGQVRNLLARAVPRFNADGELTEWIGVTIDITPTKRAEKEARRLAERLESVLESTTDGILLVDREWRIRYSNPRARQMMAMQPGMLGRPVWELFPGGSGTIFAERSQWAMKAGEPVAFEGYYPPMDSWFDVRAFPTPEGLAFYFQEVTGRVKAAAERDRYLAELIEAHAQLDGLFQNAPVGLAFFDSGGRYRRVNEALATINGRSPDGHIGRTVREVIPQMHEYAEPAFEAVFSRKETYREHITSADGSKHYYAAYYPIFAGEEVTGVGVICEEITPRVEADRALRRSREELEHLVRQRTEELDLAYVRLRGIIDSTSDLIAAVDNDFRLLAFNRAYLREFEEIFGSVPHIGASMLDLLAPIPDEQERARQIWTRALSGETFTVEGEFGDARRRRTLYEATFSPIHDGAGQLIGAAHVVRDVTGRKRDEERLRQSLAEKEVLLKEVHHRVKNNLQVVSSLLRMQSRTVADPSVRRIFQESQNRVQAMALVHENLYQTGDLSNIEMRRYLSQVVGNLLQSHARPGVMADVQSPPGILLPIERAIPCGLIVNELVSNSLKHAFSGMAAGQVTVILERNEEELRLTVGDNGTGLPEDFHFPSDRSLGLQVVDSLVSQLRGRVTIGPPALFIIDFPADSQD